MECCVFVTDKAAADFLNYNIISEKFAVSNSNNSVNQHFFQIINNI